MSKTTNKLTVISTFNGQGAASEALRQLGIDFSMDTVCEINKMANQTYYANFPKTNHVDDINDLLETIPENKKVDLLVQTPECKSFSGEGKGEGLDSEKGKLFITAVNLQKKIDASVVIYENSAQITSNNKKISEHKSLINKSYHLTIGNSLHRIEKLLLEDNRYNYYWKILSPATHAGFPQNRQRLFIIGIKKELDNGSFSFPHKQPLKYTVSDFLEDNPDKSYFVNLHTRYNNHTYKFFESKRVEGKAHKVGEFETKKYNRDKGIFAPYVAPCITCGNNTTFWIDDIPRHLTVQEIKEIQGYSKDYIIVGGKTAQLEQLGNTVSPPVYKVLFNKVFEAVNFKQSASHKKHYSFVKKTVCEPDFNYLNITEDKAKEILTAINNGGTASLVIEKYKSLEDKKSGKIEKKYIISISDLKQLGFRNKTAGVYRYKITGKKSTVKKVAKHYVLFTRLGGKGKFANKFEQIHNQMGMNTKKVDTVIDGFFGGGGYTLKNIEKLNFDNYIINDLDPFIVKTMKAVKENHSKVIEYFHNINNKYLELVPKCLKEVKQCSQEHLALRVNYPELKSYYQNIIHTLDKHNEHNIYEVAAMYIFAMNRSTGGFFKYKPDNTIDDTNFNHKYSPMDKEHMIILWSYLLNRYKVQIEQKDIFEVLNDKSISDNSLLYLDPPYLNTKEDYGQDNSNKFQVKLIKESQRFNYRIYSNEDCETLYRLNIPSYFNGSIDFERKNNPGNKNSDIKKIRKEYLAFSIKDIQPNSSKAINNIDFIDNQKELVA